MNQKISCCGLICQKTQVEKETGFLSFINIISTLGVTISPEESESIGTTLRWIKAPLDLVLIFDRSPFMTDTRYEVSLNCAINFIDPEGNIVMEDMKLDVVIPKEMNRYYATFNFPRGVATSRPGKHVLQVTAQNQETGVIEILCSQPLYIHMSDTNGELVELQ